ncbi:MAG: hypothetical protein K6F00_06640 [Lachnospiraceae bacterium]|nr:hypothetical protein [Lachnospiraceae bacterium]
MYGLKAMLKREQVYLEGILEKVEKKPDDTTEGKLRISVDHGQLRYYHCVDDVHGSYISTGDKELPKQLAQKAYDSAVIRKAEFRLKQIKSFLKNYEDNEIENLYTCLHAKRQLLIDPVEFTIDHLREQWFAEPYTGKEFREGTAVILTERGERVRSKSEKILADYFCRNHILYKYEKPLFLKGYGIVYPDFTFFSEKLRKEIYWEHEGMMDDPNYAKAAVKKINAYQMNGIMPGEQLILTYETEESVLNSQLIKTLAEKYLDRNDPAGP